MDADWSMQDGVYDQSPDPDGEDSDGLPYGTPRDIRPGNTAKFFNTDVPLNRTVFSLLEEG
jgi:hypothetical protein